MSPIVAPAEFSRVFRVDDLPPGGSTVTLTADASECAALARRFGLLALHSLVAKVRLQPRAQQRGGGRGVEAEGSFAAEVEQSCVVTLEPVASRPSGRFTLRFAEQAEIEADADTELDVEAEDLPEPLVDGAFDLGEAVAELVALAIEPYPRAPGAVFEAPAGVNEAPESPFAVLRRRSAKS